MRWHGLRGYAALVSAAVTAAGMVLLATGPAQAAATARPAAGASAASPVVTGQAAAGKSAATGGRRAGAAAREDFTPAGCAVAPKDAGSKVFARCFALVRTNLEHQMVVSPDQPPSGALGPADIQSAYDLDTAGGSGKTIAIVDAYGYVNAESDLATFRSYYGLPACTTANGCFSKLDENGGTNYPPDGEGWSLEQALDLDAVSSVCPNCHITLIEAASNSIDDLGTAEDTAASLPGVVAISNSYGVDGEESDEQSYDHYYDHPGIAVNAATGDDGDVVSWPASGDDVMAVGGTTLTQDSSVPRGWQETAWDSGGSGCSLYEPRPAYQDSIDTDCPGNKATADISADADPDTGLAVFDTDAADGYSGWYQVGGTSLSTPLISGMFGLAAAPVPGTYPVTYPYADPDQSTDLNDITTGSNGSCGTVLCTAGPGWDGPTGLGTPDGVGALQSGPTGSISGAVTSGGQPVTGVTVTATDVATGFAASVVTDSTGHYSLTLPATTYDLTASPYGYRSKTVDGVVVSQGATVTENLTLKKIPTDTLSGTVTDGSGHKWPLYAKITIGGDPDGTLYTNPYTGAYSVSLPQKTTYQLQITPVPQGYAAKDMSVHLGTAGKVENIKIPADTFGCFAPGYSVKYDGTGTQFTGWTGSTPQDGWTNTNELESDGGNGWIFGDNPAGVGEPPGSDGDFAIIDASYPYPSISEAYMTSPVVNLAAVSSPEIAFDTDYSPNGSYSSAYVELSTDGGTSWTRVWNGTSGGNEGEVNIPIPQAAGQSDVQVMFSFWADGYGYWSLDNVVIGAEQCLTTHGGLVAGQVSDNNTGGALDGATVTSAATPAETVTTSDEPGAGDGFYELFAAGSGGQQFTAADSNNYTPDTATVTVAANAVTRQDFALQAGRLAVSAGSVSSTVVLGKSASKKLTFTNTGTEPVQVSLSQQDEGFTPAGGARQARAAGVPLERVKGHFSPAAAGSGYASPGKSAGAAATAGGHVTRTGRAVPAGTSWSAIADYPTTVRDNSVAYDPGNGDVYSVGGSAGADLTLTAAGYMYDPSAGSWSPIADAPAALNAATAQFIDGTLYLVGGWNSHEAVLNTTYAYDPSSDSWTQVADLPAGVAGAASAVVDGQLYVVGGCSSNCGSSYGVYSYDPVSNTWTQHASYPAGPVAWESCAGLGGKLVCAGGDNDWTSTSYDSTWIFDPGSDTWTQGAAMPYDDWGAAYAAAGGMLEIANGITGNGTEITNQAAAYDPSSNTWTALPDTNTAEYRGGGACGMYTIGGSTSLSLVSATAEVLPGYDYCGPSVPWLSESQPQFTVAAGQSVQVTVTLDSAAVSQPGTYAAELAVGTNTPYATSPVTVSMQVNPPKSWGEITGTVTDAGTGDPVGGASVQVCTMYDTKTGTCGPVTYTLTTDGDGSYQLWLPTGYNPLAVDVSADGYQPVLKIARITAGGTTTLDIALTKT